MSMLGVCRGLLRKTPLARRFLRGIYTPKVSYGLSSLDYLNGYVTTHVCRLVTSHSTKVMELEAWVNS